MKFIFIILIFSTSLWAKKPFKEKDLSIILYHTVGTGQETTRNREEVVKVRGKITKEDGDYFLVSKELDLKLEMKKFGQDHVCDWFLFICIKRMEHLKFNLTNKDLILITRLMLKSAGSGVYGPIEHDIQSILIGCFDPDPKKRHKCESFSAGSSRFKEITQNFLNPNEEECEDYTMNFFNDTFGLSDLVMIADRQSEEAIRQEVLDTSFSLKIQLDSL